MLYQSTAQTYFYQKGHCWFTTEYMDLVQRNFAIPPTCGNDMNFGRPPVSWSDLHKSDAMLGSVQYELAIMICSTLYGTLVGGSKELPPKNGTRLLRFLDDFKRFFRKRDQLEMGNFCLQIQVNTPPLLATLGVINIHSRRYGNQPISLGSYLEGFFLYFSKSISGYRRYRYL